MSKKYNLVGEKFGMLTVINRNGSKNGRAYWLCQCDCGNKTNVATNSLNSGKTKSCGCISIERIKNQNKGKSFVRDISGNRYGKLVVIEFSHISEDRKRTYWKCKCDCGKEIITRGDGLKSGHTSSCGCYNKEIVSKTKGATTHGMTNDRIYKIYCGMKNRCLNPNTAGYMNYGGRGIKVCDEWLDDFMSFYNWAMENGYSDKLSIDRIDVNGNYEPSNCRWATEKEQSNNTRRTVFVTYNNEEKPISYWASQFGIKPKTIKNRLKNGWSVEEALNTPVGKKK